MWEPAGRVQRILVSVMAELFSSSDNTVAGHAEYCQSEYATTAPDAAYVVVREAGAPAFASDPPFRSWYVIW